MTWNVIQTIVNDASGATSVDPDDRDARVRSAASHLLDHVYEVLAGDYGVGRGAVLDSRAYAAIEQLVASAMIAMHDHDLEESGKLIAAIVNDNARIESPPSST